MRCFQYQMGQYMTGHALFWKNSEVEIHGDIIMGTG